MSDRQEPAIAPKVDVAARRAEVLAEHATDLALICAEDALIRYVGPTVERVSDAVTAKRYSAPAHHGLWGCG